MTTKKPSPTNAAVLFQDKSNHTYTAKTGADPDTHFFGKQDQDPHYSAKLNPNLDPHQSKIQELSTVESQNETVQGL